jgi:hypothetical protein
VKGGAGVQQKGGICVLLCVLAASSRHGNCSAPDSIQGQQHPQVQNICGHDPVLIGHTLVSPAGAGLRDSDWFRGTISAKSL